MKKRLLSILLVLLMALTLLPLGALADENSKCGESLTWNLDEIGILTISGTGDMYDYSEEPAPWSEYSDIITSITIDYGVTSIGTSAFTGCSNVQQINIPDSVEHIDPYAFSFCKGLHTVKLPASLTLISEDLFAECANLKNIDIPGSVTEIGANAFLRCTAFSLTELPDGIKSIGAAAFANCGRIESLTLPETLESIGNAAFNGTAIDKASFDGTLEEWAAIGGDGCGIARDKIDFLKHVCDFSGGWEYDEHKHWQSCSCGKTQNEGEHTGDGDTCTVCDAALSEALGSGSIDGGLSWSLSRSGALTISGSGKMPDFSSVANAAPWDKQKDKIQSAVIESGVQNISGGAFSGCTALEKVSISDTVAQIDLNAFDGCTALAEFEVAADNKAFSSDGGVLFSADKKLLRCPVGKAADCTVPSGTVAIAGGAFKDCSKLERLVIPDSVTAIGKSAFEKATNLKSITIKSTSLKKVGKKAFKGIHAKAKIKVPAKKLRSYKRLLKGKGQKAGVKITK